MGRPIGLIPARTLEMLMTVHRIPARGLLIANVSTPHSEIVKGQRLAEVVTEIWDALASKGYFDCWPSTLIVAARQH